MAKIGKTIFWQMQSEQLFDTIKEKEIGSGCNSVRFMHILNLYQPAGEKGLGEIQQAALESMQTAKLLYCALNEEAVIDFVSVQNPEERYLVPQNFTSAINLSRYVTDVGNFATAYRLPLLFDILSLAKNSSSIADWVVFTNSDICLTPGFYQTAKTLINQGFDSLIINRRTVHGFNPDKLGIIAVADLGEFHPGLDCFIFPRTWLDQFASGTSCIGAGQVMRSLLLNLVCKAQSLLVLTQAHLTYHYGDDRKWWFDPSMKEYEAHNIEQTEIVYKKLIKIARNKTILHEFFQKLPKYKTKSAS